MKQQTVTCTAPVVLYEGSAAWHFAVLPKTISAKVRSTATRKTKGWHSVRVEAVIGKTTWETSIFWDSGSTAYLLPLKLSVREKEHIYAGKKVRCALRYA